MLTFTLLNVSDWSNADLTAQNMEVLGAKGINIKRREGEGLIYCNS